MNHRQRAALATKLELQGARVRETKAGFIARIPGNDMAVIWHRGAASDSRRADKNLRADITKAGLAWPFDNEQDQGKKAA